MDDASIMMTGERVRVGVFVDGVWGRWDRNDGGLDVQWAGLGRPATLASSRDAPHAGCTAGCAHNALPAYSRRSRVVDRYLRWVNFSERGAGRQ